MVGSCCCCLIVDGFLVSGCCRGMVDDGMGGGSDGRSFGRGVEVVVVADDCLRILLLLLAADTFEMGKKIPQLG